MNIHQNQVALVTGAAGDIGTAIVAALLKRDIIVAGSDINTAKLNKLSKSLGYEDLEGVENFIPVPMNVLDSGSIQNGLDTIMSRKGPIDILINNAGGITTPTLQTTTEESWQADIDLNLNSAWRCMNAVTPHMIKQHSGVIINIASVNGLGIYGHPGYSVAKAGLIHLTKFSAVELGPKGIRTVAISPGTVRTQAWHERSEADPNILENAKRWYPAKNISTPADIAKMVVFAALDAPKTFNGDILTIDGGLTVGHDVILSAFTG